MSMELYVFSDRRLKSIADWQAAISAEGFPVRLTTGVPIEELNGILPVQLGGQLTDFECVHWHGPEVMAEMSDIDFGHPWVHVLALRWGADFFAGPAAYMAAAAYAKACGGVLFDCEEGKIITPEQAASIGRELEQGIPEMQEYLRSIMEKLKNQR
jgi:hypothetical protein